MPQGGDRAGLSALDASTLCHKLARISLKRPESPAITVLSGIPKMRILDVNFLVIDTT
jgi:hypothetical protein